MDQLQLRLLGPPQVVLNGTRLDLPSAKAQALLFYLAVTARPHDRAHLAGLLWGGLPEDSARRNLRGALNQLRPSLHAFLLASRQSITFNPAAPCWLDTAELQAAARAGSAAGLRQAVAHHRGEFLQGFYVRDAPEFEGWVTLERERLRQLVLEARHALAEAAEADGDLPAAIDEVRAILALDSWREEAHRHLMRLLALAGRRSEALAQFETCRRLLAEALGVEPAAATTTLYEQVRGGWPAQPPGAAAPPSPAERPPPHNLPAETTPFVGRQAELAQIAALLAEPGCRLLTLFGPGGIGKTRLALQAARQALATFEDGAWLVALEAVASPDLITTAIAGALGVPLTGRSPAETLVLNYLRERSALLLLDNFEHLAAGSDVLVRLLEAAPGVRLLVTSREALNLYEETVLLVEGLPYPPEGVDLPAPADLYAYDSAMLFAQRARRVHLGFDREANADAVARICRLLHGIPLGLELAAAWVRTVPPAEIARELAASLALPATTVRNVPARHRSLVAAFDHSWSLLRPAEQQCLRRLSVFQGGFAAAAAEAVAGATRRDLSALADKALVAITAAGRYDLHPLIKQCAFARLAEHPAEQAECQARHTAFYAALLAEHEAAVSGPEQHASLDAIGADLGNVRAAWAAAVAARRAHHLNQMVEAVYNFYSKRGLHHEGVRQLGRAIDALRPEGPSPVLARLLVRQGRLSENISRDFAVPSALFTEGLALARQFAMPVEDATARMGLGALALMRGDHAQAGDHLRQALDVCRQAGLNNPLANVLIFLAWQAGATRDLAQAEAYAREAIAVHQANGDLVGVAAALTALGKTNSDLGRFTEAEAAYAEALKLCRQNGHQLGMGQALTGLVAVNVRQGRLDQAAAYADESLQATRAVGDRMGTAIALHNLGELAARGGRHQHAVTRYREALDIYHAIAADQRRIANTERQLAASLQALGAGATATPTDSREPGP